MRIRIQDPKNVHMDPDPKPNFFYSDPEGVKMKEDNLKNQIFNIINQNYIKKQLKIIKHKVLHKDPYIYVSTSLFT